MSVIYTLYEEYLQKTKSLLFQDMQEIHAQICDEIKADDEAKEIYEELVNNATRYVAFRAEWFLWSAEEKMERDSYRTSCHNSLIVKFNMLSRYLKMQGKDASWRERLGFEEEDAYNRKVIGDFACYIVFVNSLNAR